MSALSSLLVRDDVVSIQRIEDALQRQVLEGGDIDTALLELSAAPENVINSYRAAIFGVPAASRQHLMHVDSNTLLAVPREVAERYRIVPLWIDQGVLVFAVATPPSARVMEELDAALSVRLAIRIATEMRIEAALASHYGIVIPGRLRQLAEQLEKQEPGALRPVAPLRATVPPPARASSLPPAPRGSAYPTDGRVSSIPAPPLQPVVPTASHPAVTMMRAQSIGASPSEPAPTTAPHERRPAGAIGTLPGGFPEPNTLRRAPIVATFDPQSPVAAPDAHAERPSRSEDWRKRTLPSGTLTGMVAVTTGAGEARTSSPPDPASVRPLGSDSDREPTVRVNTEPASSPPPGSTALPMRRSRSRSLSSLRGPLTREKADALLDRAEDRNAIIEVFFAFARQYFDCAAIFAMREDRAVGLETYGLSGIGDIRAISVPLEKTGTLDEVSRSLLPRVADLSRRPADRRLASVLGRLSSQPAAVVPLSLRKRAVLFLYGDRSGEGFEIDALSDLIEFVPAVSRAFERVIRTSKLLAAGALTAMREEEEAAVAASLPPPDPVPVLEPGVHPLDFARPQAMPASYAPQTGRGAARPIADTFTREAFSTLGVGRQAPPPPSAEAARRASISETDIETRATQQVRMPSVNLPPREPLSPRESDPVRRAPTGSLRPSDTYTLLAGKPVDASGSYSMQDAVTDVLKTSRSEPPPQVRRGVADVRGAESSDAAVAGSASRASASSPPPAQSKAPSQRPPKSDSGRPPRGDARSEDGQASYATEVVRLPARRQSSLPPPNAATTATSGAPPHTERQTSASEPAPPSRSHSDSGLELDGLLRDLCSSGPDDEMPFVSALGRLGGVVLPALVQRFPGPLWFDRSEPFQRLAPGRDVSAVARALYAFHERSIPFLLELLAAPNADLRFYALLLVADIRVEALVDDLVPLLSDADPQVKDLARTLLLRLRNLPGFRPVLEDLRGAVALDQLAAETRVDALNILATLRDASSVDVLVMALSATDHRVASAAHEALRTITGQDHGLAARKWQSWFTEHGKRDRIEWLIDGLMHSDEAVRTLAGNELQRATQQYFGFHPGSAKKERERVQKKYLEWFKARQT